MTSSLGRTLVNIGLFFSEYFTEGILHFIRDNIEKQGFIMDYVSSTLNENIKKSIKNIYDLDVDSVPLEHPENEKFGDYSTSVSLVISKKLKKIPLDIAKEISKDLNHKDIYFEDNYGKYPLFSSIEAVSPGFINFKFSDLFLKNQITEVLDKGDSFGSNISGEGKIIIIEFSAPNPNKPLHIGHSRNNFLGSSLSELFLFSGYNVIRMNYMHDWGTHICKSMLMYKKYGEGKEPDKKPDHFVGDFYRMYEVEHEKDPQGLDTELSDMFKKMESRDKETLNLWKKITGWAYEGWKSTYENENVVFDRLEYQSNYTRAGKEIIDLALKEGVAIKDSTGAVVAKLEEYGIPDKVLLRSDGTPIYITQDIQMAKENFEKYNYEKRIYVVDKRQTDYFKQLFKFLELLGFKWAPRLFHLAYGWISLPEGAMSSRAGTVVGADEVFEKILDLEKEEIENSMKEITNLEDTGRKIALGAYRYGMLKMDSKQDIVFDIKNVTKFEGNTGPYIMYTYARAMSIIEKAGFESNAVSYKPEDFEGVALSDREISLLRDIYKFPEIIMSCVDNMTPHILANYLYDYCQKFNSFYGEVPVLNAEEKVRDFRLFLVSGASQVIKNGLKLLGIKAVDKM